MFQSYRTIIRPMYKNGCMDKQSLRDLEGVCCIQVYILAVSYEQGVTHYNYYKMVQKFNYCTLTYTSNNKYSPFYSNYSVLHPTST
jgi:hypothetical protein